MRIVWDEPKRIATLALRQLDFAKIDADFFSRAKISTSRDGRYLALGLMEDRAYAVVFKPLGAEAISIISLRRANDRERRTL